MYTIFSLVPKTIKYVVFILLLTIPAQSFAQQPNIIKVADLRPGMIGIGFSVFNGVEPERFYAILGEKVDMPGVSMILAKISGGSSLELPLEAIGPVAGISGSPVYVNCPSMNSTQEECIARGQLVGSVSFGLGSFVLGGMNAGITPAENMFGNKMQGYLSMMEKNFSIFNFDSNANIDKKYSGLAIPIGPWDQLAEFLDKSMIRPTDKLAFKSKPENYYVAKQSPSSDTATSNIKPGSMIMVYVARGDIDMGAAGTVTWRDGDTIYAFGHPFTGRGFCILPFLHISVAATLQTPQNPHKITGEKLVESGIIRLDGSSEIIGDMRYESRDVHMELSLKLPDETTYSLNEDFAPVSDYRDPLFVAIPKFWAKNTFGDISGAAISYQARIYFEDQPEIFISRDIYPITTKIEGVDIKVNPFSQMVDEVISTVLSAENLDNVRIRSIKIDAKVIDGKNIWKPVRASFVEDSVSAGDKAVLSLVMVPNSKIKDMKQIDVPIEIPSNIFEGRDDSSLTVSVFVQSGNYYDPKNGKTNFSEFSEWVAKFNNKSSFGTDKIYIQILVPTKKPSVVADGMWRSMDFKATPGNISEDGKYEVSLIILPSLDGVVDIDKFFTFQVTKKSVEDTTVRPIAKSKKWYHIWRWFK